MTQRNQTRKLLDRLDLNLLRAFLAVYDGAGVTAAARQLHLTQPTLSNALSRLRKALGDPLFVREGISLKPTPFAQRLAPAVRTALAGIGSALNTEPDFDPASARRRFTVAMTDAGQMVFLPKVARTLRQEAPGLRLDAVPLDLGGPSRTPDPLVSALAEGELDCAVGPLAPGPHNGLIVERLFSEQYVGLLPLGSRRDSDKKRVMKPSLSMLRQMPLVLVEQATTHHRVIGDSLQAMRLGDNVVCRVPYFSSVAPMIAAYDAMAIVPSEIGAILASEGRGRVVPLPFSLGRYTVSLIRHPRFEHDAGLNWFCAVIRATLAK